MNEFNKINYERIEKERIIYNKNSYHNYMKIEKYSQIDRVFSENELKILRFQKKVKSYKNELEKVKKEYHLNELRIKSNQLDILSNLDDIEVKFKIEFQEELFRRKRVLSKEISRLEGIIKSLYKR